MAKTPDEIWVEFDDAEDFTNPPVWEGMIWHEKIDRACTEYVCRAHVETLEAAAYERGVEDCIRAVKEGAWPEDGIYGPEDAAIQTAERATVDFAVEEMRALLPQKGKAND